jgi:hypothetical protein
VRVGSYNPLSATLFSFINDGVLFNDGSKTIPSVYWSIDEPDCAADEDDADDFPKGVMIMYVVVFSIFTISVIISVLTWKRWRKSSDFKQLD